jgi:hypothetical protein
MHKRTITALAVVLFSSSLLTGLVLAQGAADWDVIGAGGGHAEAGIYSLDGTIGQALAGRIGNAPYELCVGFWCGTATDYKVFLPVVLK